ncbi:MAG TPA: porin family protein [Bacteroidia bacterium]|jgi:opacity protein-like surface antigen
MKKLNFIILGTLFSTIAIAQTSTATDTGVSTEQTKTTQDEDPPFRSGEFGVRFMPSFSRMEFRNLDGETVKGDVVLSYGYGALLALNSKHVGVQLEAIYNSYAQKYKDHDMERKVNISYLNIPLLLTLNTDKSKVVNLSAAIGPQMGINVGSKLETTGTNNTNNGDSLHAVLAVKKADLGFAYGAGLEFAVNPPRTVRINLGFRGVYGLIDISDKSKTVATDSYLILDRTNMETYSGYIGLSFIF